MMRQDYAYIDNLYSCYVGDNKFKYKHVFTPNPKYGKNSVAEIKSINKVKQPERYNELKDNTKNTMFMRKDTI